MNTTVRAGGAAASRWAIWISIAAPEALSSAPLCTLPVLSGIEAAEAAEAEVIVVRADDDGLVAQHRVAAGQKADHVLARPARHVGVLATGASRATVKDWNQPPAAGWSPTCPEPPGQVGGRRVGAGECPSSVRPEPVGAEEPDVVQRHDRR